MAIPGLKFSLDVGVIVSANPGSIENIVSEFFNVPLKNMVGKGRKSEYLYPRYLAMAMLKKHTGMSLKSIGARFNGRDHSTVIKSLKNVVDACDSSQWHRNAYNEVDDLITNVSTRKHLK